MTREEAIRILSNRDGYGIPSGYNGGYAEAIEVAIKALKSDLEKEFSPKGFANEMRRISRNDDVESAHFQADKLMCKLLRELGYDEGVDIFEEMGKYYS